MTAALVDLNALCLAQEQRIRAIQTTAPQFHRGQPVLRAHDLPTVRRLPTGRCHVCRRAVRGQRVLCAVCRAEDYARRARAWAELHR